jgi:hypothetical protein
MKRFRLSTLMLLIVIVALSVALAVYHRRAAGREAELQAQLAESQADLAILRDVALRLEKELLDQGRRMATSELEQAKRADVQRQPK